MNGTDKRRELLSALSSAMGPIKTVEPLYNEYISTERFYATVRKRMAHYPSAITLQGAGLICGCVLFVIINGLFFGYTGTEAFILLAALSALTIGAFVLTARRTVLGCYCSVQACQKRCEDLYQRYLAALNELSIDLDYLPAAYRNLNAIETFYEYILYNRASDIPEAISLYEEEMYREGMLDLQMRNLIENRRQTLIQERSYNDINKYINVNYTIKIK